MEPSFGERALGAGRVDRTVGLSKWEFKTSGVEECDGLRRRFTSSARGVEPNLTTSADNLAGQAPLVKPAVARDDRADSNA
jgi:hypothetical protein